jgi:uncharacterized RDD family membrane protein YckC
LEDLLADGKASRVHAVNLEESSPVTPDEIRARAPATDRLHGFPGWGEVLVQPPGETAPDIADFGEAREPGVQTRIEAVGVAPYAESGTDLLREPQDDLLQASVDRPTPEALPKGGFWLRLVAVGLDVLFLNVVSCVVLVIVFLVTGVLQVIMSEVSAQNVGPFELIQIIQAAMQPHLPLFAAVYVSLLLAALLYRPVCHAVWGKTLGKKMVGLRVITIAGEPIGFGRALARTLALSISLAPLGLGCLWAAWSRHKQGWHDKLAGTYVIKEIA